MTVHLNEAVTILDTLHSDLLPADAQVMFVPVAVVAALLEAYAGATTEYASERQNFGTEKCLQTDEIDMRRAIPTREFIRRRQENGGKVFRRRVIVTEDWEELVEGAKS